MAGQDLVTSVVEDLIAAENAHDVDRAAGLFSQGAIVDLPTGTLDSPAKIREWQAGLAAGHFRATIGPIHVDANQASFAGTVSFDPFHSLGIDAMGSLWEVRVEDGKISRFTYHFTPEGLAALNAAMGAAGGQTPAEGG